MARTLALVYISALLGCSLAATEAVAQSFGVELHATMMPASGGMAGVSIAQPQARYRAIPPR